MSRGRFITIEGIEGAGKSTAMDAIAGQLAASGIQSVVTREPGGTELGESVRGLLLDPAFKGMAPSTELLLMFAARSQHIAEVIRPSLDQGHWVVSDRFTDASYAYQGAGRQMGWEPIAVLEKLVQGDLRPDRVLILDVPPDVGLGRARQVSKPDRFEREQEQFFDRVRQAYLERAKADPERYQVIDASAPQDQVSAQVRESIAQWIEQENGS